MRKPKLDEIRGDLHALACFSEPDAAETLKLAAGRIGALERSQAELLAALELVFDMHAKPVFQGNPFTLPLEWGQARFVLDRAKKG